MFGVFHIWDTDGGFGDAIRQEDLICTFLDLEEAEAFKQKFERPHIYECPYDCLECGKLEIRELPNPGEYDEDKFWWLKE